MHSCSKLQKKEKQRQRLSKSLVRVPTQAWPENGGHQPVFTKVLKTKDVQKADGLFGLVLLIRWLVNGTVDFLHNPNEKSSVYTLEQIHGHQQ